MTTINGDLRRTFLLPLLLLLACSAKAQPPGFANGEDRGVVENDAINEASGLAASLRTPGLFWTHNDSGDTTRVFAMTDRGEDRGSWYLEGVSARDWEDIAVGPGPVDSLSYLYVGEIGDNDARYSTIAIYRVAEPEVGEGSDGGVLSGVETITCRYPDGPRDAEGLFVDPRTRDIYIVTKRERSVRVYRLAWPYSTSETNTLEQVATLDGLTMITAADISADGSEVLLKSYFMIYYWSRGDDQSVGEAMSVKPEELPYALEPQGEAIAWGADRGYYTTSEEFQGLPARMVHYRRLDSSVEERVDGAGGRGELDLRAER